MAIDLSLSRPPYLGQVFLVIDHALDERVRYKLAEAEQAFSSIVSGEAKSTNVQSNAPPNIPRIELKSGKQHILIANNRIQFGLSFDASLDIAKAYDIIKKKAENFLISAQKFQKLDYKSVVGFVIHINQPCEKSKNEISQYFAEHLYKGPLIGSLASFDLKLGFEVNGLLKNFSFNIYELKEFNFLNNTGEQKTLIINFDDIAAKEMGIACILDINSKTKAQKAKQGDVAYDYKTTVSEILREMDAMFNTERVALLPIEHPHG